MSYIGNHAEQALGRLAEQFKNKLRIAAVVAAHARQWQEIEDALEQLLVMRDVDTAEGVQLDVLGKIVGEARGGQADAQYRLRVRAAIRRNLSCGAVEDVLAVFRALVGAAALGTARFRIADLYPAGFTFFLSGYALVAANVPIFRDFLRRSRPVAVQAWFGWTEVPDADTFVTGTSACLTASSMAGATSFAVAGGLYLPAQGTVIVDEGLATEETLAYTARTATTISGFTAAQAHAAGSACSLTTSVGKGLGDEAAPGGGGKLAGVLEA